MGSGSSSQTIDPQTMGMLNDQSAKLNRTNTTGTYGSSEWSVGPNTGRYKQHVSLDPSQQRQLDTRNQIAEGMLGNAKTQLGDINSPFSFSSSVSNPARASFDSSMSRMSPEFEQQNRTFDQKMSNSGIPLGSEAYNKAKHDLSQGQSDQVQQAAEKSSGTQANMDLNQRQQRYSDIANMLGSQNQQTPVAGTQGAIDTTGNFNMLNNGADSLLNQGAAKQQSGIGTMASLLMLL